MNEVERYISSNWENTFRYQTHDVGRRLGLPYPYTVAGVAEKFQDMYYWGTYFTNVGLLISGYTKQAQNNVDNMLWLVEKYGYMLNANGTWALTRSQPPFLSLMVHEIYEATKDKAWLAKAYESLKKEYHFWQTERITPTGLNRYFGSDPDWEKCAERYCQRLELELPQDPELRKEYSASFQAGAESGWDFSSRCGLFNHRFNWADLNAMLYGMEQNMAFFSEELQKNEEKQWHQAAELRRERMNQYLWNQEQGAFFDYDFTTGKQSSLLTPAVFVPMFTGVATEEQARRTVNNLPRLEHEFGLASSENKKNLLGGQWDFPHGWPPSHYLAIRALLRYGYTEAALRIAKKMKEVMEQSFEATGFLWEKYNVLTGKPSLSQEYQTPPIMGWSASIYLYCKELTEQK